MLPLLASGECIAGTVVINEVLANAPGQDSGSGSGGDRFEFIEILNDSEEAVDLWGWFIDDGDARDELRAWEDPDLPWDGVLFGTTLLPPDCFALIVDPEVTDSGPPFPFTVPESTLVLTVANTTLGDGLSTTDPLLLLDADERVVDTFGTPDEDDGFPGDPGDGISLERLDPGLPDSPSNWGGCISSAGATPGAANSQNRSVDAMLIDQKLYPTKQSIDVGEEVELSCTVAGFGRENLPVLSVEYYATEGFRADLDGLSPFRVVDVQGGVASGESVLVKTGWSSNRAGLYSLVAYVNAAGDFYGDNDTAKTSIRVGISLTAVVINEIYAWRSGDEPQWIEIINSGPDLVRISGWQLADEGENSAQFPEGEIYIPGYACLVLTGNRDEFLKYNGTVPPFRVVEVVSFPVFNRSGDSVVLRDRWGTMVDSVGYGVAPADGVGVSWERVSAGVHSLIPSNWALSLDESGKTPGRGNSVALESIPEGRGLTVYPSVITPNGDGKSDRVYISYRVPFLSASFSLRIFNMAGVEVATVIKGVRASGEGSFLWDGRSKDGIVLPAGLYILLLDCQEEVSRERILLKKTVVVAPRF